MKLLQLNIWEGKLLKEVLAFIDKVRPDILCLQEVFSCQGDIRLPDLMFNSLELIQKQTGFAHSFFSPTFTAEYAGVPASFGIAILSRYPLNNKESTFVHGSYSPNGIAAPNTRVLQHCQVLVDGKSLSLVNHHGYWESTQFGSEVTTEKMRLVKETTQSLPTPIMFAGDLNVVNESPAMRVFDGFLTDLTAKHNIATTLSQLGKVSFNIACDHILVSDDVQVKNFSVSEDLISDHKALILEFDI